MERCRLIWRNGDFAGVIFAPTNYDRARRSI
jgi:hypothetical protein